jgi:hypothetical protein
MLSTNCCTATGSLFLDDNFLIPPCVNTKMPTEVEEEEEGQPDPLFETTDEGRTELGTLDFPLKEENRPSL